MDNVTGKSMFDPYYSRIQELLFDGKSIRETYEYIEKYFGLYTSLDNFRGYVRRRHLDWYMPLRPERDARTHDGSGH